MVWVRGFEPLASRFQGGHSTELSYTQTQGAAPRTLSVVRRWVAVVG